MATAKLQGSFDIPRKPLLPSNFVLEVESKGSPGHLGASAFPFLSGFASHYTHGLVFTGLLDVNEQRIVGNCPCKLLKFLRHYEQGLGPQLGTIAYFGSALFLQEIEKMMLLSSKSRGH